MKKTKGFTLIEIIIVIVILGIVGSIGSLILQMAFRSINDNKALMQATWQGQIVLQRMAREVREAETIDSASTSTQIDFTDINGIPIIYSFSGSNLLRNGTIVAKNTTAPSLEYYKFNASNDFEVATDKSETKCITISVSFTKNGSTVPLETTICPRNL